MNVKSGTYKHSNKEDGGYETKRDAAKKDCKTQRLADPEICTFDKCCAW
jgi:hypothetical protein